MTIDNHCGQDDQAFPGSQQAEAHSLIALEQSALYAARLAIARWITTSSAANASTDAPAPSLVQADWYAQAQQNFQQWLGRGGFAQYDIPAPAACLTFVSGGQVTIELLPGANSYPVDVQNIEE